MAGGHLGRKSLAGGVLGRESLAIRLVERMSTEAQAGGGTCVTEERAPEPAPQSRPEKSPQDRRLDCFVGGVALAGAAAMVVSVLWGSALDRSPPVWQLLLALAGFGLAESPILEIRFGHNQYSFTWSEAVVVLGLYFLPGAWLILLAPAGVAVGNLLTKSSPRKTAFNAASTAAGILLAEVVYKAWGGAGPSLVLARPLTWLPLVLGSLAFFLWNGATVAVAVALSQRLHPVGVYLKGLPVSAFVWAGNTVVGILGCVVARTTPAALVFGPALLALLAYAYNSSLRAIEERDTWQTLESASREVARLRKSHMAPAVLDRAEGLFKAEFVELMLTDGAPGTSGAVFRRTDGGRTEELTVDPMQDAAGFWPRAFSEGAPFILRAESAPAPQRRDLEAHGMEVCWVAPLNTSRGCFGTLRIGFRGQVWLNPRELKVLATFANQVAVAAHNASLFDEIGAQHTKLRRIVDGSSDGIVSLDAAGEITVWNPAMERSTGILEAEALGRPIHDVLPATTESGEALDAAAWDAILAADDDDPRLVEISGSAGARWLQLSTGVVEEGGAQSTTVLTARDVTKIRELEEAKGDFVATVGHELRTPLTALKGFLLTMRKPKFPLDKREMVEATLERMLAQEERLERLVEAVLSVSAMDRGDFTVAAENVCVDDVLTTAVEKAGLQAEHPVEVSMAGLPGTAVGDPNRIAQVLDALLDNAGKFTDPGTAVHLSVERDGDRVRVTVADEGPGIPSDQLEAVFDRFTRLGDHLTRVQYGTGIGLYIARRVVDAMGGEIWAESALGEGATFRFTLPAAELPITVVL